MDPETGTTVRSAAILEHYHPWEHEISFLQGKYDKKHSNIKFNVLCCKFKNEEKKLLKSILES